MIALAENLRATTKRSAPRPIARKLALLVATAVVVATLILGGVIGWLELSRYAEMKSRSLLGTARVFAAATARATAARDSFAAYQAMKAIAHIPELSYARIENARGQIFAVMGGATQLNHDIRISDSAAAIPPLALLSTHGIQASVPIIDGGLTVGRFILVADSSDLAAHLWSSVRGVALGAALALVVALAIAQRLQRGLTRPLLELNEAMWRIRRKHSYGDRVAAKSDDEVGLLIEGFNGMLAEIDERDRKLAAHRRGLETEVNDRTRDLQAAKDAAERANAAKSDFLATMSHEIRTPMNGVLVMAELLAAGDMPDRQRRYAEVISKSGHSLLAVINDILDFSKIESGKMDLEMVALDPARLAEDVTSLFGARAQEKGVDLVSFVSPRTPRLITGDPVRLNQVIGNLVNNALKFTERGAVVLEIAPHPRHASRIRISVSDTGVGIAPDKLADIFGAFTQADQSTTRRFGGTGLGLAISKRLVEAMGGELRVKSGVGDGSTFYFSLPLGAHQLPDPWPRVMTPAAKAIVAVESDATREVLSRYLTASGYDVMAGPARGAPILADLTIADPVLLSNVRRAAGSQVLCLSRFGDPAAHRMLAEGKADALLARPLARSELLVLLQRIAAGAPLRAAAAAKSGESGASPRFKRLSVLVADDGAVNREVAIEALSRLGADVTTAEDGFGVIAAFERQAFDIVLMDVSMPELDGFEATRRIRALEAEQGRPPTPIVALTAHVVGDAADAWRGAGMDAVLHKPYTLRALADCLDRFAPAEKRTSSDSIPVSGPETLRAEETKAEEIAPPAAAALAQDDDCLDRETIRELSAVARDAAGGFLSRVFGLYYENAPKCLAEIERAAQARDDVAISRAAHAVKSMSYNVGARKVVTIAANLEERANLRGASVANDDIEALARALDEACKALRRLEEEAAADPPKCATLPQSGDLLTPRHLFYK